MTKDKVLLLLKNTEDYMSGEVMSKEIGVSRAAIHTAINKLRKDGYEIQSATNRGYRLENSVDQLTYGEIVSHLQEKRKTKIICFDTIDSTNTKLKALAYDGAENGTVVVANEQTAGRGRLGRKFQSTKDQGIYMSILMRPEEGVSNISEITAWVSVAIARAIEGVTDVTPDIKWVNDIIMNGKKICGILTEMAMEGETGFIQYLIVGIGINVHNQECDFPKEIREIAGSIDMQTGKRINRAELAAAMIKELDDMFLQWPKNKAEYLEYYRERCINTGKEVRVLRGKEQKQGYAKEVTEDFQLRIRYEDGSEEIVSSGEVSVRGLYGYV